MYSTFYLYPETSGPLNGTARELKYCELCGKSFVRRPSPTVVYTLRTQRFWSVCGYSSEFPAELRRDRGEKLCPACVERPFTRDARVEELAASQARYREQLPTEREATHRRVYQMPDYESEWRKKRVAAAEWKEKIRQAFRERGRMTTADLQEFIPQCFVSQDAYLCCKSVGLKLQRIGYVTRTGFVGRPPRVYVLPGCSPETLAQ